MAIEFETTVVPEKPLVPGVSILGASVVFEMVAHQRVKQNLVNPDEEQLNLKVPAGKKWTVTQSFSIKEEDI